jgi:hypothetical protein
MTAPVALTPAHLVHAVVPPAPDDAGGDPRPHLTAGIDRVDLLLGIADVLTARFPTLPEPPRQQTLQELVQVARRRLRADRVRRSVEELSARRFVLDRVRAQLGTP